MLRNVMIGALAGLAMTLCNAPFAQAQSGTAAEAKAMLEKAVAAVNADKVKALEMFDKGEGGFKDRDLYPFCFNIADGVFTAPAGAHGKDVRALRDQNRKAYGEEIFNAVQDGKIAEVSYLYARPGEAKPLPKVSLITKAGDQG